MPPPCEEFTTSEPFFNATRVRPPGVTKTLLGETRANGLRSTCRGVRPDFFKIGTVDNDKLGWAI